MSDLEMLTEKLDEANQLIEDTTTFADLIYGTEAMHKVFGLVLDNENALIEKLGFKGYNIICTKCWDKIEKLNSKLSSTWKDRQTREELRI
jgi:hypothetical protein